MTETAFLFGWQPSRQPMPPMSELKKDMADLKAHGFNLVKSLSE